MRLIIAGSRTLNDTALVAALIETSVFFREPDMKPTTIVCGGAKGVDQIAARWCQATHSTATNLFLPDWDGQGKSAGYKRNETMADNADALLAIWDGVSKGTEHMINIARAKGLEVQVIMCRTYHHNQGAYLSSIVNGAGKVDA